MEKVLIDTDVILDFFFDRKPFSEDAAKILSMCENVKINGFVTSIILSNIYYLLRKTATRERVIEKLKMLLKIIDLIITDKKAVEDALNSEFKDFEDALQNFSAHNTNQIRVIITRNTKDYKTSKLAIMNPETYLKTIQ
jgi:predicted nucleic acid-binding protein